MWIDQRGSEVLSDAECHRLLALAAKEGEVGRMAVSRPTAPVIHPVNFAYHDRHVLVRLGTGFMAEAAAGALVAFEIDRVDPQAAVAWSVLVRGLATVLSGNDQRVDSGHPPPEDLAPHPFVPSPGHVILSIRADVIDGRRFSLVPVFSPEPTADPAPSP